MPNKSTKSTSKDKSKSKSKKPIKKTKAKSKKSKTKKVALKEQIDDLYEKISNVTGKNKVITLDQYDVYDKELSKLEKKLKEYEEEYTEQNNIETTEECSYDELTWDEFNESYKTLQDMETKLDDDLDLSKLMDLYKKGNKCIKECTYYLDNKKANIKIEK